MKISVIIPTLNEAQHMGKTLDHVFSQDQDFFEVLVVDGGSQDETVSLCSKYPCQILHSKRRGRGVQMNLGARKASGDVFLFLHADTILPPNASQKITQALNQVNVLAGGFSKVFDSRHFLLQWEEHLCKFRKRFLGAIGGDQAMFIRAQTFHHVGGYPEIRVMEEFVLCKKVSKKGDLKLLPETVQTSARRFLTKGVFRCYLRMFFVNLLYQLHVPHRVVERVYYSE